MPLNGDRLLVLNGVFVSKLGRFSLKLLRGGLASGLDDSGVEEASLSVSVFFVESRSLESLSFGTSGCFSSSLIVICMIKSNAGDSPTQNIDFETLYAIQRRK